MPSHSLVDSAALLLLIVANGTPVLLSLLLGDRWARPLDNGRVWHDGRPILGSHKTWRGLLGGALASGVAAELLSIDFVTGVAFGLLALAGDLLSSFTKRRLARESGRSTPLIDQLPEALLPLLVMRGALKLDSVSIFGTVMVFTLLDMAAEKALSGRRAPSR